MERIVVGIDGSLGAAEAAREAIELARYTGAALTFVGVWQPYLPIVSDPHFKRVKSTDLNTVRHGVFAALAKAEPHGVHADYEIVEGDAAEELVRLSRLRDADLIVVGPRRHASASAPVHSVSRRVVQEADRPVLVAKASAPEAIAAARNPLWLTV